MQVASKIKPVNNANFKIADAKDIAIDNIDVKSKFTEVHNEFSEKIKELKPHKLSWINVAELGADIDGQKDSTEIIQYALDNYKIVYLPSGKYLVKNLYLSSYNVIIGDGKQTILELLDIEGNLINIKKNASLCEVRNLTLSGGSMKRKKTQNGLVCQDRSETEVYDASHIFDNIQIINFSNDAVVIGSEIRGCKLTNIKILKCNGYGMFVAGTDNMIMHCSAGELGKSGFVIYQNNRMMSCKPFLCGLLNKIDFYGLEILGNYNNISNIDIQQTYCSGIKIAGAGNSIRFNSDGVGTNNKDNDDFISILVFDSMASGNIVEGSCVSGTLNGFANYVCFFRSKENEVCGQINNRINLIATVNSNCLIDLKYTNTTRLHPSNVFVINGKRVNQGYDNNLITNKKNGYAVYKGHSGYTEKVISDKGIWRYEFPIALSDLTSNSGCNIRFPINNALINKGSRLYYRAKIICENVDNNPLICKKPTLYTNLGNVETLNNCYGCYNGYYEGVMDITNINHLTENDSIEASLGLGVLLLENLEFKTKETTIISIEDLYIQVI